jgi:hypothetical protein
MAGIIEAIGMPIPAGIMGIDCMAICEAGFMGYILVR